MLARDARAHGVLRQALRLSIGRLLGTDRTLSTVTTVGVLVSAAVVALLTTPQVFGAPMVGADRPSVVAEELSSGVTNSRQARLEKRAQMRATHAERETPSWSEHATPSALEAKDFERFGFGLPAAGEVDLWGPSIRNDIGEPTVAASDASLAPEKRAADCEWQSGYGIPGLDGPAYALEPFDDGSGEALFVGGRFLTAGGVLASGIAKWDGAAWSAVGGGVDGVVWALRVFDDGTGSALYAGGFFDNAGGVPALSIAKWDGASWSALGLGIDSDVYALEVFDDGGGDALYAGGFIYEAGGIPVDNIAKWDGTSWSALGDGLDDDVEELITFDDGSGDDLYATGFFSSSGRIPLFGIARWDGAAWSDLDGGLDAPGLSLTIFDDGGGAELYVGGFFFEVGSGPTIAPGVASWDGTSWAALGGGVFDSFLDPGAVDDMTVFDDGGGEALYVGGGFTMAGGIPASNIAKWDGTDWSALGLGTQAPVVTLNTFDDGGGVDLVAGGFFRIAGGTAVQGIAQWDGAAWSSMTPAEALVGLDEKILAFATFDDGSGEALYAGGEFLTADGVVAPGIAKWDGSAWSPVGEGIGCLDIGPGMRQTADGGDKGVVIPFGCSDPAVIALAVYDDGGGPALYIGGRFDFAGPMLAANIVKWDGTSFSTVAGGTNDQVEALAVYDDGSGADLYVGGEFDLVDLFTPAPFIAQWDGTSWSGVGGGTDDDVETLSVFDDGLGGGEKLIAGGEFNFAGGAPADYIASWDGTTWAPLGLGTDDEVESLTVFDDGTGDALFVGGDFLGAGGAPAAFVAKWDGAAWSPLGSGLDDEVNVVVPFDAGDGEQLYVGGFFTAAGGSPASRIARWDGASWSPLGAGVDNPFSAYSFDPWVEALAAFDDGSGASLYVGGDFLTAGGLVATYFAEWACPTLDYGDAPDPSYNTLFASDGARHDVVAGFYLGSAVDAEIDGLEDAAALGDDNDNVDDEDGVTLGVLVAGATASVDVEASAAGELDAWVDWNADGTFDSGEKIFDGENLAAGTNNLLVAVPTGASIGNTFARFRLTSAGIADPDGRAPDGEVEDYQVTVNAGAVFQVNDVMASEGNVGTMGFMFTVSRSHNLSAASVSVVTADGGAVAGSDYTAVPFQVLNFAAGGALSQTVTVLVNGDTTVELDESFSVLLSAPVAGTISDGIGVGTILNDDSAALTFTDTTRSEAAGTLFFRLTLSNPLDVAISVDVSTVDGTATVADSDYTAVSNQTLTFPAGVTLGGFSVTVDNDSTVEMTETLSAVLSNLMDSGRGVSLGPDGIGTIANDDLAEVSTSTESQLESAGAMTFTVTLSNPVDIDITVAASTVAGTASAGSDFVALSSETVSVTAGTTEQTFEVVINDDSTVELDESFTTSLGSISASGRAVAISTAGAGTIENDDAAVISTVDVSQEEAAGAMTFMVTLSNPVDVATSVNVSTVDDTATTADGDYDALSSQTVNFAAGETLGMVDVTVNDDSNVEPDETFTATLSALVAGGRDVSLGTGGTGTIENDDAAVVSIADVSQEEAAGAMSFTVSLSNPVDVATSVNVSTSNGTATTADSDYDAVSSQTVNFAAGETSATVDVTVNDDSKVEPDETFTTTLSALVAGGRDVSLGTGGTGTIENDDDALLTISDVSLDEGTGGTTAFVFTVTMSNESSLEATVDYATADGTAEDEAGDGDYGAVSGTLTFAPGVTQQTVNVTVEGDAMEEPATEDFFVDLTGASGATLSDSRGVGTITDDDDQGPPVVASVDAGDNTVEDCEEVRQPVSLLTVTFDQAMHDPTGDTEVDDVTNPDNYRLFMAGPDNDLDSEVCGDPVGDDVSVLIDGVSYDAGAFTASVQFDSGNVLASAPFRFLACDTLSDGAGNGLDGGNFERSFRIERENLFLNGQFDCDIEAWELVSTLPEEISASEDDVDDAAISGSSAITNLTASTGFTMGQCLPANSEVSFIASAAVQVAADPGIEVLAGLVCEFFLAEDCAGDVISNALESFLVGDTAGAWVRIESELASPAGATSALCSFDITTPSADSFDARVDDLALLRPGVIFDDGFESGDTSAWSSTR